MAEFVAAANFAIATENGYANRERHCLHLRDRPLSHDDPHLRNYPHLHDRDLA